MGQKIIYVKMTKVWAQFQIGDVVRFGEPKGRSRIELGMGHEVPKSEYDQQQKKRVVKTPKAETATKKPVAETAEASPEVKQKKDIVPEKGKQEPSKEDSKKTGK